jgi:uncharacterized protein YndB with AHSA1/START domain
MTSVTVQRTIHAPAELVFRAVSDIENLPSAVPAIVRVELLSDRTSGVGARFRETRRMKGKETTTELEVTEYVENQRVRMVADSHGTVWDSVFAVEPAGGATRLTITMHARAQKLLPRLLNPLFKGLFRKGLGEHLDAVKRYCESSAAPPAGPDPRVLV